MEEFDLQDSQLYNEDGIENEENELLMEQLQSSMDTEEEQQKAVTSRCIKEKSSTKHPYKRLSMSKKLSQYAQSRPRSHEGRFIPIRSKTMINKENQCTSEQWDINIAADIIIKPKYFD
ncbi:hypothetical protein ALC53_09201 [Atta colombica]|uniref:Uncharacterized protein n=1 Tax=Atta colombica TaxID=520822 RepID=A0A195B774_9HYME|nr:hypothetical protein ALC53_09201 [Atta colombica]